MKRPASSESGPRFQAQIRHYHRTSPPKAGSWDAWVDGTESASTAGRVLIVKKVLIALVVVSLLVALVLGFINIA
jgi:hypothetical protein